MLARKWSSRVPLSVDAMHGAGYLGQLSRTYVRVGDYDAAIDVLDTLLSIPSYINVPWLRIDPDYEPLRDHPRFQALIEKYEKEHGR